MTHTGSATVTRVYRYTCAKCANWIDAGHARDPQTGPRTKGWGRRKAEGGWICPGHVALRAERLAAELAYRRAHPKPKGFAAMPMAQRKAIASMGGKASGASDTRHRWTSESAKAAGRIGGRASATKAKKAKSQTVAA